MSDHKQIIEELQKLKETEETLAQVKGRRYAACVSMTLRSLLLQECLLLGNEDRMLKTFADETASNTLLMGLLASGVPDNKAARKEFATNLTMMAKSVLQVTRSIL